MIKSLLVFFSISILFFRVAGAQTPNISYVTPQTAYIGKPMTAATITNTGGAVPAKRYPQIDFMNTTQAQIFNNLRDLVVTATGDVFIVAEDQIYRFRPDGTFSLFAGSNTSATVDGTGTGASFQEILGIDKDTQGNLYVTETNFADAQNSRIRKITPAGVVTTVATGLPNPWAIAVAPDGAFYFSSGNAIYKTTNIGSYILIAGTPNVTGKADGVGASATFNQPYHIVLDQSGNIYVDDTGNYLIRKVATNGTVTTIAGSNIGTADGTGSAAKFFQPSDIAIDSRGNLIVPDISGSIRKVTAAGVVTTIAQIPYAGGTNSSWLNSSYPTNIAIDANDNLWSMAPNGVYTISTTGYSVSPALPAGLTLGTDGSISGTPTALSTAQNYTIKAQNGSGIGAAVVNLGVVIPPDPPLISSFTPTSGYPNLLVTVTGNYFTGTTAVTIGGKAASSFAVASPTSLTAYVASGATSGDVAVTNPNGTATLAGFTLIPPPTITSFSPTTGGNGTLITINGTGFTNATGVTIGGNFATSTVVSDTKITATAGPFGSSGSVLVNAPSGTATLAGFTYVSAPAITTITPTSTPAGQTITINGSNLATTSAVKFGTIAATSFTVVSDSQITVVVPASAGTSLNITTLGGNTSYNGAFVLIPPPTITSANPLKTGVGSSILINGSNLSNAQVKIGGVSAAIIFASSNQIYATVESGAASGTIDVTTAAGTVSFPGFIFVPAPTIASFTPQTGKAGDIITITGTNLDNVTNVSFGSVSAAFTIVSPSSIQATVGNGANGSLSVFSSGGSASLVGFTYLGPAITSFTPTAAGAGQSVVITGSNFTGTTEVDFGGVPATSFNVNSATQITATVGSGKSGSVTVVTPQGAGSLSGFSHPGPSISSISPLAAGPNSTQTITISGSNFTGATSVTFGGVPAASYNVLSSGIISATPAATSVSGDVVVTTPLGTDKGTGFIWVQPPVLTSFTPTSQSHLGTVTITGNNLTGVLSVKLGGTAATLLSNPSSTSLSVIVGNGATGDITVSTIGGTATIPGFTYTSPTITGVSPLTAVAGQTITITGTSLDQVTGVQFGNTNAASFNIVSPTTITAVVGAGTTGSVLVTAPSGAVSTFPGFTFVSPASIFGVTPNQGGNGTTISINGINLATTTAVQVGGVNATIVSVADNQVKATVGVGATGNISVTTFAGTVQFNGFTWYLAPTIGSVNPAAAAAQTTLTITGSNFVNVQSVAFGNHVVGFNIVSPTQITVVVPSNIISGNIVVTTLGGSATFAGFVFIPAPTITSFNTTGQGQNATVTITGTNFNNVSSVQFGGVEAQSFVVNSSTSITAIVGAGATGAITVTAASGAGTIAGFVYKNPPAIASFSPVNGPVGTTITITGNNFSTTAANNQVYFGPVAGKVVSATATQLRVNVPAGANGLINVLNADNGLAGTSNLAFNVTNSKGFTGFTNKFTIPVGAATFPSLYKVFDFDGDGQPDLLIAKADSLFILLHGANPVLSPSSFKQKIVLETGRQPVAIGLGDLDGDGKVDIVYSFPHSTAVLRNTSVGSSISFSQIGFDSINNDTGAGIQIRDIDLDGLPDVILSSGYIYPNTTNGATISFGSPTFLANTDASSNTSFALTDVDGDGKPDPILGSSYDGISIFQNNTLPGNITSALLPINYIPLNYYRADMSAVADFDGDGKPDIAGNNFNATQFLVARNTAVNGTINTSSFATPSLFQDDKFMFDGIFAADMDGDGKPDIAGTTNFDVNYSKNTSTTGNISFSSPVPLASAVSSAYIQYVSASDMDGDGRMDLIMIDGTNNSIVIFNNGPATTPQITSVSPLTAGTGTTVTIVGKNLDATTSVNFGTKAATSFKVVAPDTVTAVVGAGETGAVTLQSLNGPASFPGFKFILQPTLTSAIASTDGSGMINIVGANLTTTTAVSIAGVAATSFTVISDTNIKANFGVLSGMLTVTTTGGTATLANVTTTPQAPIIASLSTMASINGTSVTITGTNFTGATAVKFGGIDATSFTINSSTSITAIVGAAKSGDVTVTTPLGTGSLTGFVYTLILPPSNFKFAITGETCKGSVNGSIAITATQSLNYTATITGNGLNAPYNFTTTQTITNLAVGTYNVCITVAGQPNYQQCFTAVVAEPKDLSVYSTINPPQNTVDLVLNGGTQYQISLNGTLYSTANNTISLPLMAGVNKLTVTTDKLCQGVVEQTINNTGKVSPYPDPFQNIINLNLGLSNVDKVLVEIHSVSDGGLVLSKQFTNQSGVLQLDASNIKSGIYALRLTLNDTVQVFKIMKK